MGKTCEPKVFSFQCMTKFTTKKKKEISVKKKKLAMVKLHLEVSLELLWQCGVSSVSDYLLSWIILVHKVYSCPSDAQSQH